MSQVIIITGASSGIGKASALRLIDEGHRVYAGARRIEKMQDIIQAGGEAVELDVTDVASIQKFVGVVIKKEGRIDVLFNNAGYALYGAVEDIEIDRAREQFEVNMFGMAAMTKEVLPYMRSQRSGKIINTSSIGGKIYTPLGAWYHATKHAIEGWSDCLRLELKDYGIKVVIIEPGIIATGFEKVMGYNLEISSKEGTGAYEKITQRMFKSSHKVYEKAQSSPVSVVSDLVCKVVKSKDPRTRYVVGKYGFIIFIRKLLPDSIFDKIVMRMAE